MARSGIFTALAPATAARHGDSSSHDGRRRPRRRNRNRGRSRSRTN